MEYEITNQPAFAELLLTLDADEEIQAESGSLVSYSATVERAQLGYDAVARSTRLSAAEARFFRPLRRR